MRTDYMTVEQAEKLVCPFIQETTIGTGYQQIYSNDCANINCITTKCMAWRMTKTRKTVPSNIDKLDVSYNNFIKENKQLEGKDGSYCGVELIFSNLEPQDCEGYCIRLGEV